MRKGLLSLTFVFCSLLLTCGAAEAAAKRSTIPPFLGKTFLEKAYRGKNLSALYSFLISEAQKNLSYADFKKQLQERNSVDIGTKFSVKILRQEAFSSDEGLLYYVVQVNYPRISFKKDFYALERIKVQTENGEWKVSGLPVRLIVSDMKEKCGKNEFTILYGLMEQDRSRELLAYSKNEAVSGSLAEAAMRAQKGEYRRALVEYQKVLQLEVNHSEAQAGSARCKEALARNENAD